MKKKFSLWLNIVTICLCVCAIAIGVYAASSASLTASGTIGFTAHGVEMTIEGTIMGYVTDPDDAGTYVSTPKALTESGNNLTFPESAYFTDLVEDKVSDITIEITVKHTSAYPIEVSLLIDDSVPSNISFDITNQVQTLQASSDGTTEVPGTITIVMNLHDANTDITPSANNLKLTVYAEKEQLVRTDETKGDYVVMGHKLVNNEVKPVRWFPFAKTADNGTTWTKFNSATDKLAADDLGKGNYYFVSEYVLDVGTINEGKWSYANGVAYNNTYKNTSPYLDVEYDTLSANNYLSSNIRQFLKGNTVQKLGQYNSTDKVYETSGEYVNLYTSYALGGSVYDKITARTASDLYETDTAGNTYDTINTKYTELTTEDNASDKLWLLSKSDLTNLPNVESNSSDTDLITATFRSEVNCGWWLRSPSAGSVISAWSVYPTGSVNAIEVIVPCGVRPAFEI